MRETRLSGLMRGGSLFNGVAVQKKKKKGSCLLYRPRLVCFIRAHPCHPRERFGLLGIPIFRHKEHKEASSGRREWCESL